NKTPTRKLSSSGSKTFLVEYPEQERGTLNEQITEYLSNIYPHKMMDFSSIPSDSIEMQSIELGQVSPSVTALIVQMEITKKSVKHYILYKCQVKDNKLEIIDLNSLCWGRENAFQLNKAFNVYQVCRPGTGVIAAKVIKEEDFNMKEWQVAFKLAKGNSNSFVLKYHSAQMFGTQTVILMEFANMKV
ncbi:MAG: hypothetical protein EZS28_036887, partial [Streblomastix strix]